MSWELGYFALLPQLHLLLHFEVTTNRFARSRGPDRRGLDVLRTRLPQRGDLEIWRIHPYDLLTAWRPE